MNITIRPFSMRGRIKEGWQNWHLFPEIGIGRDYSNAITGVPKDYLIIQIYE